MKGAGWVWAAITCLALADLAAMALLRRQNVGDTIARTPRDFVPIRLLFVAAWAWYTIPRLVEHLTVGRDDRLTVAGSAQAGLSPLASQVNWLLSLLLLSTAAVAAIHYSRQGSGHGGLLVLALLPWVTIGAIAYTQDEELPMLAAIYPLIALAIWFARPPLRVFATLGWLTGATAVLSVFMGLVTDVGTLDNLGFVDKFGWAALAGPFTHPNMLGSVMVLGLPSVMLIRHSHGKYLTLAVVCSALVWSSSRSSMGATVACGLGVLVVSRARTASVRRTIVWASILALAGLIWWLPWHVDQLTDFNSRGRVWVGSIHRWGDALWFGGGPEAYSAPGQYHSWLGDYAFHGHNMLVDALVVGGMAFAASVGLLVVILTARAADASAAGSHFAYAFALVFVADGVLEVSTNFWLPSSTSLVVWFTLCAALFSREASVPLADQTAEEGSILAKRVA